MSLKRFCEKIRVVSFCYVWLMVSIKQAVLFCSTVVKRFWVKLKTHLGLIFPTNTLKLGRKEVGIWVTNYHRPCLLLRLITVLCMLHSTVRYQRSWQLIHHFGNFCKCLSMNWIAAGSRQSWIFPSFFYYSNLLHTLHMLDTEVGKKWPRQPTSMVTNEAVKLRSSRSEIKDPYRARTGSLKMFFTDGN